MVWNYIYGLGLNILARIKSTGWNFKYRLNCDIEAGFK
jgi:hypothetical protein